MRGKRAIKIIIQGVIGLTILIAIYFSVRKYSIPSISFSYPFFFFSVFFYLLLNLSLAFRLKKVLESMDCFLDFKKVFSAHLGGMILSDLTPGRSGYLTTPLFLERVSDCELNKGMAGILVPQAIEFLVKIFGALLALLLLASAAGFGRVLAISAIAIAIVLSLSALIILGSWSRFANRMPLPSFIGRRLESYTKHSVKTREAIGIVLSLTLVGWFLTAFQWYFIGAALSLRLTFLHYLLLQPLITLLMFIPLTPAGLGIMEGGAIGVMFLLGVNPPTAFIYSILVRLSTLLADLPGLLTVARAPATIFKNV
jgi:hypothetical protein